MIDVPELDMYLKTCFYIFNFTSEVYSRFEFSDELKYWVNYLQNTSQMLKRFEDTVERPEFGFVFEMGRVNSRFGVREVIGLRDPSLMLPAPFLKVYPRLLYRYGYLTEPEDISSFNYFFRYYPKMVVGSYINRPDNGEEEMMPSQYWIKGTHQRQNGVTRISYNVAVEVDLHTIIEEELHSQIADLHQTDTVETIEQRIIDEMPDLKSEIEMNLNRILSTEEKKFYDIGDTLSEECASELRILESFVQKFESEVIENSRINYWEMAIARRQDRGEVGQNT